LILLVIVVFAIVKDCLFVVKEPVLTAEPGKESVRQLRVRRKHRRSKAQGTRYMVQAKAQVSRFKEGKRFKAQGCGNFLIAPIIRINIRSRVQGRIDSA
jgi:hypothetical protein